MTRNPPPAPSEFEPEFIAGLKAIFEDRIVFNQVLGLKITSLKPDRVVGRIDMRRELIGHPAYNRLHGGVVSAGLDAMGGLACLGCDALHTVADDMAAAGAPLPPLHVVVHALGDRRTVYWQGLIQRDRGSAVASEQNS